MIVFFQKNYLIFIFEKVENSRLFLEIVRNVVNIFVEVKDRKNVVNAIIVVEV